MLAVKKKGNLKLSKKFVTTMTKEGKESLQRFFQEKLPNVEADWKHLKSVLSDATKHVFGKKRTETITTGLMSMMKKSNNYLKKRNKLES